MSAENQPGTLRPNIKRNQAVLGKAVHAGALMRLHELFPDATVSVRHETERVPLGEGEPIRMDGPRDRAQHSTQVWIDLDGRWVPNCGRPKPDSVIFGEAVCHPDDTFDKRTGILIAYRRVLESARREARHREQVETYRRLGPAQERAAIH